MNVPLIVALGWAAWILAGMVGFIFWWTAERDFTSSELIIAALAGTLGPLSWVVGYILHSQKSGPIVIFKKRRG